MMDHVYMPSGTSILVPPGIALKPVVRGKAPVSHPQIGALEGDEAAIVSFRLEYSEAAGCYEVASFGVDRGSLPLEVGGAFMRTVRVHAITREGILAAIPSWAIGIAQLRTLRDRGGLRSFPEYKPTEEESLLLTGVIYRIAEISGENPALAVAESIGLKQRTATNWIQRARAAGFMTSTEHQRAVRRVAKMVEPFVQADSREQFDAFLEERNLTPEDLKALIERAVADGND